VSVELENPGRELAAALRTMLLAAAKLAELAARRRELMLRRAQSQSQQEQRSVQQRIAAERRVAEEALRAIRPQMRALAELDPTRIADTYRSAAAWRENSPVAAEVAGLIETHMRAFGIDPTQLAAAARDYARRQEPTIRPGLDLTVTETDVTNANDDTTTTAGSWRDRLARELDGLAVASTTGRDAQLLAPAIADVEQLDIAAARAHYEQTQGLAADEPVTDTMRQAWRHTEARRWASTTAVADLALFAALIDEEEPGQDGPVQVVTDLWSAWRAREAVGLPHPDLAASSGAAFTAQLDRAHDWFAGADPDFYQQWSRLRSVDPARSDRHLVQRYEAGQAQAWAAEIGEDLWKHGFAAAVADQPGVELDTITHQVWVAAGKPEPDRDTAADSAATVADRWQDQVAAAGRWARATDPQAWRDWQSWRTDPGATPTQLAARDAVIVADHHTAQAEGWVSAARAEGTLRERVDTSSPQRLFAAWRNHTAGHTELTAESPAPDRLGTAEAWYSTTDPLGYMSWRAHLDAAVDDPTRDAARAELIHDHDTHLARRWAEAAEIVGLAGVEPGTATGPADEVIATWRTHTGGVPSTQAPPQPARQPSPQQPAAAAAAQQPRRAAEPRLADLVGDRVPEEVRAGANWAQAEKAFRGLVHAGADPQHLADSVGALRFDKAKNAVALTIWGLQQASEKPAQRGARSDPAAGPADPVRNIAARAQATPPSAAVNGTRPGRNRPPARGRGGQPEQQNRSQGHGI